MGHIPLLPGSSREFPAKVCTRCALGRPLSGGLIDTQQTRTESKRDQPAERQRDASAEGENVAGGSQSSTAPQPKAELSAEQVMWEHFQQQRAVGRTPTDAELDRVAGTNNYGRAVLARWWRAGRISAAPEEVSKNGAVALSKGESSG